MVHSWAMLFQRLTEEGGTGKDDQTAWFGSSEVLKKPSFWSFLSCRHFNRCRCNESVSCGVFSGFFFFGALFLFLDRKKGSVGGQGVVKF